MPIQFRCQYCRQRLGIADSRAGAVVDCPACGRSLRVPGGDNRATDRPAPAATSEADSQLHSALQQLSAIGLGTPAETASPTARTPPASVQNFVPRKTAGAAVPPVRHSAAGAANSGAAPPDALRELAAFPAVNSEDLPLLAQPELLEEASSTDELPPAAPADQQGDPAAPATAADVEAPLVAALQELADQHPPATSAAQRPAAQRPAVRRAFGLLIPVLTGLLMFTAGYLAGHSRKAEPVAIETQTIAAPGETQPPAADPAATPEAGQISGLVQAAAADGKTVPDAGALVIIAPANNLSELRIDGRFLRDPPDSAARRAITAAFGQLGVSFTNAAEDGTFSLPLPAPGPCVLIAVSRRNSRPASAPLSSEVVSRLNDWFTAPSPVTGRLQTVVQEVTAPAGGGGVRQNLTIPAM